MYEKGFVQHADGVAKFSLGGEYIVFSSCIGISKYAPDSECGVSVGDARFRIKGDNIVLRDWDVKDSPEDPTCFEIGITGVEEGKENPSNKVNVYLNGVQISNAKSGEIKKIDFDYDDNDVIKLEEEYGIIKLHQIGLNCARKMSIIL